MAFNAATQSPMQRKRTSFGQVSSTNASLYLEKAKANMRHSTPDSEALASSDDEQEQQQRLAQMTSHQAQRSIRRPSLLSENHGPLHKKSSMSGSDNFSLATSQGTPSNADSSTWTSPTSGISRSSAANPAFPWGNTIWSDAQKGPPARLAEVLPSTNNHGSPAMAEELLNSPSHRRDSATESSIPFAIPLHPTLKTYRSQSYSVGQLDQELVGNGPRQAPPGHFGRTRAGSSYAGLQNRASRPSMLGDFSPDTSILEQLREVDDDDEASTASSEAGVRISGANARTIEQLAMENAILRQQAYQNHHSSQATSAMQYSAQQNLLGQPNTRASQRNNSVIEEPDEIVVPHEDGMADSVLNQSSIFAENRALENVKKGHWQTSLGFGGVTDVPVSRRHSFADIPLRSRQRSAGGDNRRAMNAESRGAAHGEILTPQGYGDNTPYFPHPQSRASDLNRPPSSSSSTAHTFNAPQQAPNVPIGRLLSQTDQHLYVVTFKAARAEFYYVQEGTGLEVNAGDLVIVEADRGTDLGTVAHKNVDWNFAKQLKERYVIEHYNWLMMFSRQGQSGQSSLSSTTTATNGSGRLFNSAVGGMGPPGHATTSDMSVEIKPKMIKRLAQPHEIHMLREKEGNEAKAKRMCQQKVVEHHLNMEILDAEFQMDWKKLTFYYYAEAYVNFNSLVTDLFKIYKTRIWMSAINPASFVSPATTFQLGPGMMPNLSKRDRDRYAESRTKPEDDNPAMDPLHKTLPANADVMWTADRGSSMTSSMAQTAYAHYFQNQPPDFSNVNVHPEDFGRGLYSSFRSSSPMVFQQYSSPTTLQGMRNTNIHYRDDSEQAYADHLNAFQGLSLGL